MASSSCNLGFLTDGEKQVLLDRYLDIVWCDDVSEVQCVRCHRVPIQHYMSNCQHLFCRNCKTVFSDGGRWRCPQCHEYVTKLSDQDWQMEEHIYQFKVHCPNRKYGCPYQGQLLTIPGHLRGCENTREAALPAEFKGITLDTVVNQILKLNDIVGKIQDEVEALKDKCETNWKRTEEMEMKLDSLMANKALTEDVNVLKESMVNMEIVLKDVRGLSDKCEANREQTKKISEDFALDIKMLKWNAQKQAEQLDKWESVLKDVRDKCESNHNQTGAIEIKVDELTGSTKELTHCLNDQKHQMAIVEQLINDKDVSDAVEMQQLRSQLEQQQIVIEEQTQSINEQKQQSANIEQALNDREVRDAVDMQQLRSQLEQQQTQMSSVEAVVKGVKDERDKGGKETVVMARQMGTSWNLMYLEFPVKTQMPHDQLHSMTLVYEWNIREIKIDEDGEWDDTRESEVFPLTGYHYGAKANIDTDGLTNLQMIDYNQTKRPIDTRSMPKVTVVFVSQSDTTQGNQHLSTTQHSTDIIRTRFIEFKKALKYGKNIYFCSSISTFARPPYLVSNVTKLRYYIEPPSIARSFFSNDGILLWRLDNYKERKQMQVEGIIPYQESPYFYTSPQGYRVLIQLRLSEKTVYGVLWFVKGEFDSTLTQQFPHRFTMTIFNHSDQSKNLVVSGVEKEAGSTYFYFKTASVSLLESGGYVADDSLLIKAVVEPLPNAM